MKTFLKIILILSVSFTAIRYGFAYYKYRQVMNMFDQSKVESEKFITEKNPPDYIAATLRGAVTAASLGEDWLGVALSDAIIKSVKDREITGEEMSLLQEGTKAAELRRGLELESDAQIDQFLKQNKVQIEFFITSYDKYVKSQKSLQ